MLAWQLIQTKSDNPPGVICVRTFSGAQEYVVPADLVWVHNEPWCSRKVFDRVTDAIEENAGTVLLRIEQHQHKTLGEYARQRILWRVPVGAVLKAFARKCALDVLPLIHVGTGDLEYYLRTGDSEFRETAREVANWIRNTSKIQQFVPEHPQFELSSQGDRFNAIRSAARVAEIAAYPFSGGLPLLDALASSFGASRPCVQKRYEPLLTQMINAACGGQIDWVFED